jgi:hypothetical protein
MSNLKDDLQAGEVTQMNVPPKIVNNPDGTSTAIYPDGTASNNTFVVREFANPNGKGKVLQQIAELTGGTSDLFIADTGILDKLGQIGDVFNAGNVADKLASIDVKFSGPDGTGNPLSGDVELTDGQSYKFQLDGPKPGELVSVQGFTGPSGTGKLDETISVLTDGSAEIDLLGGNSALSKGAIASQETFDSQGNLSKVRTQLANGEVVVEKVNYDASGKEISQTLTTFNQQNQVVSSTVVPPGGTALPHFDGQQAIAALIGALASLSRTPAGIIGVVSPQPAQKVLLAPPH